MINMKSLLAKPNGLKYSIREINNFRLFPRHQMSSLWLVVGFLSPSMQVTEMHFNYVTACSLKIRSRPSFRNRQQQEPQ
jgi:hypothetical protein